MNTKMLTVAVLGLVACDGATDSWDVENDRSAERGDRAFVQVVHLSPDAPAVDIVVNESRRVLRDVEYLGASPAARVAPDEVQIDIPAAGGFADAAADPAASFACSLCAPPGFETPLAVTLKRSLLSLHLRYFSVALLTSSGVHSSSSARPTKVKILPG